MSAKIYEYRMEHQLNVRTTDDVLQGLRLMAKEQRTKVSAIVRTTLAELVKKHKNEESTPRMSAKQLMEGFQ